MQENDSLGGFANDDEFKKMMDEIMRKMQDNHNENTHNENTHNENTHNENTSSNQSGVQNGAQNPTSNNTNAANEFMKSFGNMMGNNPAIAAMVNNVVNAMEGIKNDTPEQISKRIAYESLGSSYNTPISGAKAEKYTEALKAANLWLDAEIDFMPPVDAKNLILRPVDWIDETLTSWERITTPIAKSTTGTLNDALREQLDQLADMMPDDENHPLKSAIGFNINGKQGMLPIEGDSNKIVNTLSAINDSQFAVQMGTALSHLAKQTFGGTDYSLPLLVPNFALVPLNIEAFATANDIELNDVVKYVTLREVATVRLFSGVPWLRAHVLAIIERYADGIHLDMHGLQETMMESAPESMEDIEKMMKSHGGSIMSLNNEQNDAKQDLETILALIEGWVDFVTLRAGAINIKNIGKLRETMTRRRLSGAGGEKAFAETIGLHLKPVKCREAFELWEKLFVARGANGRDEVWKHPNSMPNANALVDIEAFVNGASATIGDSNDTSSVPIKHDWDALLN